MDVEALDVETLVKQLSETDDPKVVRQGLGEAWNDGFKGGLGYYLPDAKYAFWKGALVGVVVMLVATNV